MSSFVMMFRSIFKDDLFFVFNVRIYDECKKMG